VAIEGLSIRLYLDHNVNARLASDLRARGFDAITTYEAGNATKSDEEQLAYATAQGHIILTFNISDFSKLDQQWHEVGKEHAGIVISEELAGSRYGELLRRALRLLNTVTAEEMRGTLRNLAEFKG
jgi:predicted nuclease of predicted toxin-antitoxin system